ncbi:MAG: hypothetical protein JW929_07885, partial [Anaerolineales bacterium]|nr:hypothetical protein [Anaerolineales bacterium]
YNLVADDGGLVWGGRITPESVAELTGICTGFHFNITEAEQIPFFFIKQYGNQSAVKTAPSPSSCPGHGGSVGLGMLPAPNASPSSAPVFSAGPFQKQNGVVKPILPFP